LTARYTGGSGFPSSVSAPFAIQVTPVSSGTLSDPITQTLGDVPTELVPGDFNGDGIVDLGFYREGNGFRMLLGNGDGTFHEIDAGISGGEPAVTADFNGDGHLDLAYGSITIDIAFGTGTGTFSGGSYLKGTDFSNAVVVADVNRDGKPDLIANGPDVVEVSVGVGDGTFEDPLSYPAGPSPSALVADDVNRDGFVDLVVANGPANGQGTVSVLLGNGAGGFGAPQSFPAGLYPTSMVAADFNRDGRSDLALAQSGSSAISLLAGNGDGTFRPPVLINLPGPPTQIFAADMNGDGIPDLIAFYGAPDATTSALAFSVLYGNGNGTFQTPINYLDARLPASMAIADVNGDGRLDVVLGFGSFASNDAYGIDVFFGTVPAIRRRPCPQPPLRLSSACPDQSANRN
jgi:hypothetical protein